MFRIRANRSAASMFGAATSYAKDAAGNVLEFATKEEAEAKAREWTRAITTGNVWYTVEAL